MTFGFTTSCYLKNDERYLNLPERLEMKTEAEIAEWFGLIAGILKQYGAHVLKGSPETFEALAEAQAKRDREYGLEMERKYGTEGQVTQFDELTSRLGPLEAGHHFTRHESNER
ncbi:MAG TPA: hypothetical protein VGG56_08495 [Terracidiphilus sp.]|jgi:phage protein U